jgi:hypothetical protein
MPLGKFTSAILIGIILTLPASAQNFTPRMWLSGSVAAGRDHNLGLAESAWLASGPLVIGARRTASYEPLSQHGLLVEAFPKRSRETAVMLGLDHEYHDFLFAAAAGPTTVSSFQFAGEQSGGDFTSRTDGHATAYDLAISAKSRFAGAGFTIYGNTGDRTIRRTFAGIFVQFGFLGAGK